MGFLVPWALSFAALSLPILILYMLKLRREERVVSSTMLWRRALRDREANSPWQRLRRNLLLLLQLLFLLLLVIALARPYNDVPLLAGGDTSSGNVILLLDASASMQATDVSPSRFEVARAQARVILDGLGPTVRGVTLIAVGDMPRVLASGTNDRPALRRALDAATVTNAEADWEAAFLLASSSTQRHPDGSPEGFPRRAGQSAQHTIVVLSDGGLPPDLPYLSGPEAPAAQMHYIPIGLIPPTSGGAGNRAISALAVREGPRGPQAFVRVLNASRQPANSLIQVHVNGILFDARTLSLSPGSEKGFVIEDLPLDTRLVEARLAEADALEIDNAAWYVRSLSEPTTVLLATPGNTFLERAVGLMPDLNPIIAHTEAGAHGGGAPTKAADATRIAQGAGLRITETLTHALQAPALYILDGVLPAALPESGNLFLIDPPASTNLFAVTGTLTRTRVSYVERDHPLLYHVDVDDLHVARARTIERPPWARTLIAADGGPLLLAGQVDGRRIAILTFDLHHSDLPLQIAFPILMANLVRWLAPASQVDVPVVESGDASSIESVGGLRPGTPVILRPQDPRLQMDAADDGRPTESSPEDSPRRAADATEITVIAPSGQRWTYPVNAKGGEPDRSDVVDTSIPFAHTHELGVYTVEQKGEAAVNRAQFAVNLFSELESRIEPQETLPGGQSADENGPAGRIDGGQPAAGGRGTPIVGHREWWRWPVLCGLLVILVEWVVHRRGWTMLTRSPGRTK